jgi:hypothetical protein
MSASAAPVARHFRQILMWPLRLMPIRSGDQVQRHPEALAAITEGNPWREQRDEFTGCPDRFPRAALPRVRDLPAPRAALPVRSGAVEFEPARLRRVTDPCVPAA